MLVNDPVSAGHKQVVAEAFCGFELPEKILLLPELLDNAQKNVLSDLLCEAAVALEVSIIVSTQVWPRVPIESLPELLTFWLGP